MSVHSITNGGLLGEWQEAGKQNQHVAAVTFLPGNKSLCALASTQACRVCHVPWLKGQSGTVNQYTCAEV